MDELAVRVEVAPGVDLLSNAARDAARQLRHGIKTFIGTSVQIDLRAAGEVERSQGKAKRVLDLRPKA